MLRLGAGDVFGPCYDPNASFTDPPWMLPANDSFVSFFKRTFEANYHPDIFQDKADLEHLVPEATPLSFYDRHIASHLTLKQVVYQPSLVQSLSKTCSLAIQKFLHDGHKFCDAGYRFSLRPHRELFRDARTTSIYYIGFAARICAAYAYKLTLHPRSETWKAPFEFVEERRGNEYLFTTEAWLAVNSQFKSLPELKEDLTEALEGQIDGLLRKYPRLATWHMFAMTDTATSMFQTLTKNASFNWEASRTIGCRTMASSSYPPDAEKSFTVSRASRRSKARDRVLTRKDATMKASKFITVPELPLQPRRYRPDLRHYIQHAWATAATYDSTFMVFHCGRYERIGFRHRASQTLYLSALIDTVNIKDPSYRKLHIGLYTAIIQDAVERYELSNLRVRKRSVDDVEEVEVPRKKKSKTDTIDEVHIAQPYDEIAERNLALVTLKYGAFCSPAPSSFLRIGPSCVPGHAVPKKYPTQTRYNAREYISLLLKEPLGQGAVGVVHPAAVTLTLESGQVVKRDMVIKLAFNKEQQKKIFNEYRIYGHLSYKPDMEGIVTVHGMFRDPESGAVGMLMNDAGQSLRRREIERGGDGRQVCTTPEEREAFRRVLRRLHEAGVRHHDIRADNLLINSRNEVFIVDLDCADYEVNRENKEHEMECLNDLLEGRYRDGAYYSY